MTTWSRPIGLALSLIFVVIVIVVALRAPGSGSAPAADLHNGQAFIQDNLWSTARYQYAVWVADDGAPHVGRRRRGEDRWLIRDLVTLPHDPLAAPTRDDLHNVYAIAVADGYVHVAGNMHDDRLRYVRGRAARLDRWTASPTPARGESVTYPVFTRLLDGTLFFWRREGMSGDGAVQLDALPPGVSRWRPRGVVLDGRPSKESPYLHHIAVDPRSGTVHLMFEWRATGSVQTNSDVGYARSSDGGSTWETSSGAPLPEPITHARAETVIDTAPRGSGLINTGGLTVDRRGNPHGVVVFDLPGGRRSLEHVWLDGRTWRREKLDGGLVDGRPQLAGTPDGRVWLLGARGSMLTAFDVSPDRPRRDPVAIARVPLHWEANYDSEALARHGTVEMLIPDDDPHVVIADLADSEQ